jgi:hypothetical protein
MSVNSSIQQDSAPGSGPGTIPFLGAENGVQIDGAGKVSLGGPLINNTVIPLSGFLLRFQGSGGNIDLVPAGDLFARTIVATGFTGFGIGQGWGFDIQRNTVVATGDARGYADNTVFAGATPGIAYACFDAAAQVFSPGAMTIDHVVAFQGRPVFDSVGGTCVSLFGHTTDGMASKNGTTTNWIDFYAQRMNAASGVLPTVVNRYGFYMEPDVRATNNWAAYYNGGMNNWMGTGITFIGTTTPTAAPAGGSTYQLQVNGDMTINGISIGSGGAPGTGGDTNMFFGKYTGRLGTLTGTNNMAFGTGSLASITSGVRNNAFGHNAGIVLTTGSLNTFMGETAGNSLTTGSNCSAFGANSGHSFGTTAGHTAIGANAGLRAGHFMSGTNCTFLGWNTSFTNDAIDTATAIGANVILTQSNTIVLGTATEFTGISTSAPTSQLDVLGTNGYAQLRLRTTYTPVNSADPNGNQGDIAWDANFFYVKTSPTSPTAWKRTALVVF